MKSNSIKSKQNNMNKNSQISKNPPPNKKGSKVPENVKKPTNLNNRNSSLTKGQQRSSPAKNNPPKNLKPSKTSIQKKDVISLSIEQKKSPDLSTILPVHFDNLKRYEDYLNKEKPETYSPLFGSILWRDALNNLPLLSSYKFKEYDLHDERPINDPITLKIKRVQEKEIDNNLY